MQFASIWHRLCRLVMPVGWAVVLPMCAAAQEDRSGAAADTVYVMQEIVVQGAERVEPRSFTLQRLPAATIEQASAASAAQIARYVPSAHVKTNSRGETLLYLRGVGERQTAVFFDGAPLNVPWDNRLDLGLIPAELVGGMTVAKGPVGVEYGANVLGGAVNLTSPALPHEGGSTGMSVLYGTGEAVQTRLIHRGSTGAFSFAGSLGYARHDGVPLPAAARLPFNQRDGDLRTNTDRRVANAFARGVYAGPGGVRLGLTLLHIDAVQGVAPEGHIPTAEARLWRYPDWRYTMAVMSGEGPAGTDARWKSAVWLGRFGQRIDAFGALDYDHVVEREESDDLSLGARLVLVRDAASGTLRLAANGLVSTHAQRNIEWRQDEQALADVGLGLTYRQWVSSLGVAYDVPVTSRLKVTLSGSYDAMLMPETGDKPPRSAFAAWNAAVGAYFDAGGGFFMRGVVGRRTRFPTMRELFGEALNRFLVNPDLRSESAFLAEVNLGVEGAAYRIEVTPFLNRTFDVIDQHHVAVEEGWKRQRINLAGSRLLGVEVATDAHVARHVYGRGSLTLMDVRRRQAGADGSVRLAEKPDVLGLASLRYVGPQGVSAVVEVTHTGRAYSLAPDNRLVPLPRSLVCNTRLSYRFDALDRFAAEVFARAENVTDALVVPQLGLPRPGRTIQVGLSVEVY